MRAPSKSRCNANPMKPELNLSPADFRRVRDLLARLAPGTEVWAFGSRVTGEAHAGSDLDLVIVDTPDAPAAGRQAAALKSAFAESALPILVDVLAWSQIPEAFRREIEARHVALQPAGVPERTPSKREPITP